MAGAARMLTCGVMVTLGLIGGSGPAEAQGLTVNVIVRNDAHLADEVVGAAQSAVVKVFAAAGIDIQWKSGNQLFVVIVPRQAAERLRLPAEIVGFSPRSEGQQGRIAYILEHRVVAVANGYSSRLDIVLGAVMAHELGHLLLPVDSHSAQGIMRAVWNQADLRKAAFGRLLFTNGQVAELRGGILSRQSAPSLSMAR